MSSYTRVPVQEEIELKESSNTSPSLLPTSSSTGGSKEEAPASREMVVFSVSFYLVAATTMVMANKWVLNAIEIPLFFLFCQLSIAVLLLQFCALFGYFKLPRLDPVVCKGLIPLIACNVLGLAFNTYCLQYVDASFYQIARGLVLPFTVFFSWFLLRTHSSGPTLIAVGIVCFGFMLGVVSEDLKASSLGVILGVASSVTTSVHAIVVKRSLPIVQNNTLDLVYYSNLLSAGVIIPFVLLSGEAWVVMDMVMGVGDNVAALSTFLWGAAVTGVFGFLICIAGFLSIKVTSPVSHMVSSAVRGVLQTFLGISLFGDHVGLGRASGIVFILAGSIYYVYTKSIESAPAPVRSPAATPSRPLSVISLSGLSQGETASAEGSPEKTRVF